MIEARGPGGPMLYRDHNPVRLAQRVVDHLRSGKGRLFLSKYRHPALVVRLVDGRPSFEVVGPEDVWMNQMRKLITTYWEDPTS